jgi:hypothetical protein
LTADWEYFYRFISGHFRFLVTVPKRKSLLDAIIFNVILYLAKLNSGLRRITDWKVRCLRLAPYAPDQNPVEDIWRQGKNRLRRHFYLNKTFAQVKKCFFNFLANQQLPSKDGSMERA